MKRPTSSLVPIVLATLSLVGCGGGEKTIQAEAGQLHILSTLLNDVEVGSTTYRVYSVSDDIGTLSDQALPKSEEIKLHHVLVLESQSGPLPKAAYARYPDGAVTPRLAAAVPLQDVAACYKDLFVAVKTVNPTLKSRDQVAKRLGDLDMTADEICSQIPSSGLSMVDYLSLFDKISSYWPGQDDIDGKAAIFFMRIKVRPVTFQQALLDNGYTWDAFLKRLSGRDNGLDEFYRLYEDSDLTIKPFLAYYMQTATQPKVAQAKSQFMLFANWLSDRLLASAMAQSDTGKFMEDLAKNVNTINQYIEIAKTVWKVVENSVGSATVNSKSPQSYVVSSQDKDFLNYYGAKESSTQVVSFVGKTYAFGWWENYRVDMQATCDFDAKHKTIPGQWLPNIAIKTPTVYAGLGLGKGYVVNGSVVASNAANRGTPESPIPSIDMTMELSATAFTTTRRNYVFQCRGDTGASYKP